MDARCSRVRRKAIVAVDGLNHYADPIAVFIFQVVALTLEEQNLSQVSLGADRMRRVSTQVS